MLKHRLTVVIFLIGIILFITYHKELNISYWHLIIWINVFLLVEFLGAYFIGFNFHLKSINQLFSSEKKVVLTFDDGPHTSNTIKVLEILNKHNVKAIFFIIGKNIEGNELVIKQLIKDGHLIGNHSFSHHQWIDLWSTKKVYEDFLLCQKKLNELGIHSNLFRPPYGVTNPNIAKAIKRLNLQSIGWNIRSYDTSSNDINKIKNRILQQLKPGAIILLHDRLNYSPELLEEIITCIKKQGYGFTTDLNYK
jgi:peptidoglycan/xylan/chitin deacetylase (PgdA/CDA1 family)